jgi:hypothetical protein
MKRLALVLAGALVALGVVVWVLRPWTAGGPAEVAAPARHAALAATGAVSRAVIPEDDLPPAGTRSLFDHLLAQADGLPFPFEKVVALLQAQDPEGRAPLALLIPRGRSLLKASAHDERPRILTAADFNAANPPGALGLAARGALFVAFVEDAAEIEVISYNEAAGRYEFQLVQDYREGGVPRIVYARRAICTTCHQGAAPIFPQRPWSETNAAPAVARAIEEARGGEAYRGVPAGVPLAVPERYDELTDVANFVPVAQRIWLDGCGAGEAGAACRRELLGQALAFAIHPGGFDPSGAAAGRLRALQARAWPTAGIAVADADLRNRDPLAEGGGLREWLRDLLLPRAFETGKTPNEDLEAFARLPPLPRELDPLLPRPPKRVLGSGDLDGVAGLAQFFTAADAALLERASRFEPARLAAAVGRIPAEFFAPAPFGRVATLNAVLAALGEKPRRYAFLDTTEMSPPQAVGVPPVRIADGSPLAPFEKYCFACHRGNPARRLDFMAGSTEAEVLANIKATAAIRDVLEWERYRGTAREGALMPPADSHQRRELEQALAREPQLLEEMRKVVPGLFDF